ncbi:O-methyltransferase, family 2 [Metarhizium rileyi]|uniref:O-methyltransferase, family 2 n=1 Tax=Metarhizium rileyi (strain RCEF 4871) TaxID=1649241 RepID=A0A167GR33_METRR|nr:O-methyltransferase, family 2 [Metarhizium rileyi RCEF 4871]
MAKFKVPSWLQPSAAVDTEKEKKKKQIRRSFSAFSQHTRTKQEVPAITNTEAVHDDPKVAAKAEVTHLLTLAKKITSEAEKLERYLKANNLPQPGFGTNAPGDFPNLPPEIQHSRQQIVYATHELGVLVRGPRESVRWGVWSYLDTLSLQIINSFGIAKLVPFEKPISLPDLQAKTTLDSINLARVVRHAMTNYIFCEPEPGMIAHTAASRKLAEDSALQDWVGFNSEDIFPSAAKVLQSLQEHPEATSLTTTGFNYAFETVGKEPMFVTLGKSPTRAKRMGGAMASLTGGEGYEVCHFVDNHDLSQEDERGGTFVDIGGSHGFVSVDLARKWKKMKFIVQDLPQTVSSAPTPICDDGSVAERVRFQAHDFFREQPVKDADVYFLRWIVHNYSSPYAVKILRNLVPALKPGARIVINDHCLREPGSENPWDEKLMRGMDMIMLTLLNAQERQEQEFRELFRAADERFVFKGVTRTPGCRMSIIEAVWEPAKPTTNGTAKH